MEIGPPEFFGELSLGNGDQNRGVSAQALEECEYLRLDPSDYRSLASSAPQVATKIAQAVLWALSEKISAVHVAMAELMGSDQAPR